MQYEEEARAVLRVWSTSWFVCASVLVMVAPAHAKTCPIAISAFTLDGRSATAVAYRLHLSPHDPSAAFTFSVSSPMGKTADLVLAAGQDAVEAVFSWPRGDLNSVRVKGYEPAGGGFISCVGLTTNIADVNRDPSTVVFAPGTLPVSHSLLPVEATEPSAPVFVHQVTAQYPKDATRAGASGRVDVLVDVNTEGKPANAVVASSSQFAPLDEAAVTATLASTYKAPELNGRPAQRRYLVPYLFPLPGTSAAGDADTKCHVRISYGWLIGLDRTTGENLYEIGLNADRRDVNSVDISLEKGDISPPVSFSRLDWQRQANGRYTTRVFALSAGQLAGSLRLESADISGQTLTCAPFTIVTWDHSAGTLSRGTPPTIPPVGVQVQPNVQVFAGSFTHKTWPAYPRDASGERDGGVTIVAVGVDAAGRPKSTEVFRSSGVESLDAAAIDAVMRCAFRPPGAPATYVTWYVFRPTLTMGEYLP